ncbi:MAG: urease accessory protein UreE [Spongiibacteraceae bacterium]
MLEVHQRLAADTSIAIDGTVMLDHLQREKGRIKTISSNGEEVRIFLARGNTLAIGEILRSNCGKHLAVTGAVEPVISASTDDWVQFSKACYHLGNRHIKIQVGDRWLRITPDHVLEDMLKLLGLQTKHEEVVFVPESGAYSQAGGHHHHNHSDDESHDYDHHH